MTVTRKSFTSEAAHMGEAFFWTCAGLVIVYLRPDPQVEHIVPAEELIAVVEDSVVVPDGSCPNGVYSPQALALNAHGTGSGPQGCNTRAASGLRIATVVIRPAGFLVTVTESGPAISK
ncbi:MAG TPA: hypothetical protein VLN58_01415, partial [Verrucomicrobiae bacterium]|nr:hypothetical protein [Verrucomicrobiae bacterium]